MNQAIGFIGLGNMGSAMVRNLSKAGCALHTYSRSPSRYEALSDCVITQHNTAAEVFSTCNTIMLNVTATADVEGLVLGKDGAIHHAKEGTIIVDFSTVDSKAVQHIANTLSNKGIFFIDCPVSGGTAGAQAATLTMMAGGNAEAFTKVEPLLNILGKTIRHVGPSGAGQAIKAANQMCMCIQLAGIAEAFVYAKQQGADLQACYELLSSGLAGSKVLSWAGPHMASGFTQPATIEARLHAKDMNMIAASASAQGINLPLLQTTARLLNELVEEGLGLEDTSRLLGIVQKHLKDS